MRPRAAGLIVTVPMLLAGCAGSDEPVDAPAEVPGTGVSVSCEVGAPVTEDQSPGRPSEPELRQELLEMRDADQAERTGESTANNDAARTDRLREIVDDVGWPTWSLVGHDGATAAWLIAQHSDHDVAFQREALGLMCAAAEAGEVDPTELAYLVDRVAVNSDEPQVYGTQVGGCVDGHAVPQPMVDEQHVDERRTRVGLEPLADYLAQFDDGCTSE